MRQLMGAVLAIALMFVPACASQSSGEQVEETDTAEVSEVVEEVDAAEEADEPEEADAVEDASNENLVDPWHIQTDQFEFDIPLYWQGKVAWDETSDKVVVYPIDAQGTHLKDYPLLWVEVVPGAQFDNVGDIGVSCITSTVGTDKHIEVWRRRWVFDCAYNSNAIPDWEQQQLVIDLSSLGQLSADDISGKGAIEPTVVTAGEAEIVEQLHLVALNS